MDDSIREGCYYIILGCLDQAPIFHITDKIQALEGKNVKEMLLNVGSGGGAAAAPTGGAGTTATEAPAEEAKEEKKEEGIVITFSTIEYAVLMSLIFPEKEESDEDMGFGLFD